jgi:uncharacterized damage-inducible protein DinB
MHGARITPVITGVEAFLSWFGGVNRRTQRDIGGLPASALTWRPPHGEGENAWSVGELVGHIAGSRSFFARTLIGDPWVMPAAEQPADIDSCILLLETSAQTVASALREAGDGALAERYPSLEQPEVTVAGWRLLMMMAEHEVHHRSQIMTYAGLERWPVAQIFNRTYEEVARLSRAAERRRHGTIPPAGPLGTS